MGRFWNELKMAFRDQATGSMKYGASSSFSHNAAAMKAARDERLGRQPQSSNETPQTKAQQSHSGGFSTPEWGSIDGHPVTFAVGWGTKKGHVLIADNHVNKATFQMTKREHKDGRKIRVSNHEHYGSGNGSNDNGTRGGKYTGPGA